tara:strand:- start:244 stop:423 length:180 start_codon:yes stop_codon:yes gene_type:complete
LEQNKGEVTAKAALPSSKIEQEIRKIIVCEESPSSANNSGKLDLRIKKSETLGELNIRF